MAEAEAIRPTGKLTAGAIGTLLMAAALLASTFLATRLIDPAGAGDVEPLLLLVLAGAVLGLALIGLGFFGLAARYGGAGGLAGFLSWVGAVGGVLVGLAVLGEPRLLSAGLVILTAGLGLGGIATGVALLVTPALGKVAGVLLIIAGSAWTLVAVATLVPPLFATVVELHMLLMVLGIIGGAIGHLMAGAQMLRAREA